MNLSVDFGLQIFGGTAMMSMFTSSGCIQSEKANLFGNRELKLHVNTVEILIVLIIVSSFIILQCDTLC